MALLEVKGLAYRYASGFSLEGIDLEIEKGRLWALIGPNGCGKSTLVKILSRYLPPQRGTVRLAARKLADYGARELARLLAVIPSENHFEFPFPVHEVVAMGRFPHLGPLESLGERDTKAIERALRLTATRELASRPISELSSGERQRVLLARALAQEPGMLILDEPNAHLDIRHQIEAFRLIRRLVDEDRLSVLVVLHDLTMAAVFCDVVALMEGGRLICVGPPQDVIETERIRSAFGADVEIRRDADGFPAVSYRARPNSGEADEGT